MKVALPSAYVDDEYRRMIAHRYGDHGRKATREQCRDYLIENGRQMDDDLCVEFDECERCRPVAVKRE